jgi:hypothetical protein
MYVLSRIIYKQAVSAVAYLELFMCLNYVYQDGLSHTF